MSDEPATAGWDAIDAALAPLYGDQEPLHYGTVHKYVLGGPDPLDGISAYRSEAPCPHWHVVTYGYSELYDKESDDPEYSGYGFEMTMRLAREPGEAQPPMWALNFLQNLARYVFQTGNVFEPGHHLPLNGPIADRETEIWAAVFAQDPELGAIQTPHGRVEFVQVVGITLDELEALKQWSSAGFLSILERVVPGLITDLSRPSILKDPAIAGEVAERTRREGSNTGSLFISPLEVMADNSRARITVGALAVESMRGLLRGRIPFDRPFILRGDDTVVLIERADRPGWELDDEGLSLRLTAELAEELAAGLQPLAGEYGLPSLPGFSLVVEQSAIKDRDGNVVRTVG